MTSTDSIVALATPAGKGALGILRLSGPDAITIADSVWKGRRLANCASHTVHLGEITDENGDTIDQAVATIFRGPNSFTGEDSIEFSLHGSQWIIREVINLLMRRGARGAEPGEYTRRAYLNGRMDLASAEGVADLIASSSKAAHKLAMQQTKGLFSKEFNALRDKLIELSSLLELELDFSEEDVEFADRSQLMETTLALLGKIDRLTKSFASGKAFKEGVPVVIAGIPNVGKSTLLNVLLQDEKAIVSDIPGTTRDVIEDTTEIGGILFRFFDTAGLRESSDTVESIGIERARCHIGKAAILLWLIDPTADIESQTQELLRGKAKISDGCVIIPVITKYDKAHTSDSVINARPSDSAVIARPSDSVINTLPSDSVVNTLLSDSVVRPDCILISNSEHTPAIDTEAEASIIHAISETLNNIGLHKPIVISATEGIGIDTLCNALAAMATRDFNPDNELLLTNARHYGDLMQAGAALRRALDQMRACQSADIIAMDIRQAISSLTSLTGAITTTDLLTSIFSHFCIGK